MNELINKLKQIIESKRYWYIKNIRFRLIRFKAIPSYFKWHFKYSNKLWDFVKENIENEYKYSEEEISEVLK